jgi:dolichyl-phosphate-mannose-protein mannosyltransferase
VLDCGSGFAGHVLDYLPTFRKPPDDKDVVMVEQPGSSPPFRLLASAAVLIALLVFICPLGVGIPLVDPDEGLHASIAQEMVEKGDWVTPRFQGEAFLDKPILFTWAQAVSLKLFGMNVAAVRLPGLLFGLAAMITTGILGWRIYSPLAGFFAAMLYGTMILPTILAQLPVHDVALIPFASLAILLFWEADRAVGFRRKAILTVAIGALLGLTCLTKGLVGVGLVGVAYGSYLLVTRRLTWEACVRGVVALSVAAMTALPWYLAMESRIPGYLHYYFVERHLLGLATDSQHHAGKAVWYYLPILLGGAMPWAVYLPIAIRDWWAQRKLAERPATDGGTTLLWCWLIACTLLLSAAGSKLVTYIWPVLPPIAILAASVWARLLEGRLSEPARRWFGSNFAPAGWTGPLLLPTALIVLHFAIGLPVPWYVGVLSVLVGFSAWIPSWLWMKGRYAQALPVGTVVPAAHMIFVLAFIAPHLAGEHTARDLAAHFNRQGALPDELVIVEERVGSAIFYLDPTLRAELQPGQIRAERARNIAGLGELDPGSLYVLAESRVDYTGKYLDVEESPWESIGRYRIYRDPELRDGGEAVAQADGLSVR